MAGLLRIGLTGGIASGKTTVAKRFRELGVPVIDADDAARAVVEPGEPGLAQVIERFGAEMLDRDGRLDRRALRARVFADPKSRRQLESILHPLIRAHMEQRLGMVNTPYAVLEIPLLVEVGNHGRVDRILVVDVAEELQVTRVTTRDGSSPAQARSILAAQTSRSSRLAAADDVVVNEGTLADLREKVDTLHDSYLRLAAAQCGGNTA